MQTIPSVRVSKLVGLGLPPVVLALVAWVGLFLKETSFHAKEIHVSQYLGSLNWPHLDFLTLAIAYGFAPFYAAIITLIVATYLGFQRSWLTGVYFTWVVLWGWLAAALIKPFVGRPRPNPELLFDPLAPVPGFLSFPSGHTAFSVGFFMALALFFVPAHARTKALSYAYLGVGFVAFSRVYVGAHFVTDTLAATLVGTMGVLFAVTIVEVFFPPTAYPFNLAPAPAA